MERAWEKTAGAEREGDVGRQVLYDVRAEGKGKGKDIYIAVWWPTGKKGGKHRQRNNKKEN